MDRSMFDGTAARQLVLVDEAETPLVLRTTVVVTRRERRPARPRLQPLVKDLYRQLELRRRRAQIAARKYVD
jgi:hypothetical protein